MARLRRSATRSAAPSTSARHGCGSPVRISGDTKVVLQHMARPVGVFPYAFKATGPRILSGNWGCGVHCCGTRLRKLELRARDACQRSVPRAFCFHPGKNRPARRCSYDNASLTHRLAATGTALRWRPTLLDGGLGPLARAAGADSVGESTRQSGVLHRQRACGEPAQATSAAGAAAGGQRSAVRVFMFFFALRRGPCTFCAPFRPVPRTNMLRRMMQRGVTSLLIFRP